MTPSPCPCCSGRAYDDCCRPYLENRAAAPDPEGLMRSRYTAFSKGNAGYLAATLDPDKFGHDAETSARGRTAYIQELEQTMAATRWVGLRVTGSGTQGPDRGWVTFAAFFSQAGEEGQLHERSAFVLKEGRWFYRDGEILPALRLGRNDPCFCGSGKKFKKCHGKSSG